MIRRTLSVARFAMGMGLFALPAVNGNAQTVASLSRFVRDDAATVTHVRINARHAAAARIHPELFGNFIEHLGGAVYPTLSAQIVFNPNLEPETPGQKTPPDWNLQNADWQESGFHSPRCVRLSAASTGEKPSELTQEIFLPVYRKVAFSGTLYLRAVQSPGSIVVEVRAEKVVFTTTLEADKADWTKRNFTLNLPPDALQRGEAAQLVFRHADGGPVDLDWICIAPQDSIGVIDPDTAQKAKVWHIPILRWPGGNFASGYHWQDGIGPQEDRPTRRNDAWGGIEPNLIGTDECLKFCDFLKTQPQMTVNAGNGTPEDAAAWVAYCNAKSDAGSAAGQWAQKRAANGHKAPYNIRTWEIGNELYGGWQIGHTDPAGNAARFVRFRDAMRKADPTIKTIATGKGDEFAGDGLRHNADWNTALLRAALADNGTPPEYLSIHPLVPLPGGLENQSYEAQYESAMAHPTFLSNTFFPMLEKQITDVEGPKARTRLAPTEWGIIVGGRDWQKTPNHDSLAGAIYNALALNAMIRHCDWITLANMTAFSHGGGIKKYNGVVVVDPQYYTQQIYAAARPQFPLETTTTGPGNDVPQRGFLPAVPNVPEVDVVSVSGANHTLTAFAVNRNLTEARTVAFHIEGFSAAHGSAIMLTAATPKERNTWETPTHVAPKPFPLPIKSLRPSTDFQIVIPPHTFVALTFGP